jgi:hypothetical protein
LILNSLYFTTAVLTTIKSLPSTPPKDHPAFLFFFANVASIPWLVTIIYWWLLSSDLFDPMATLEAKFGGSLSHTINIVFPLVDLFLGRAIVQFKYIWAPLLTTLLYIIYVVSVHLLTDKEWPYP